MLVRADWRLKSWVGGIGAWRSDLGLLGVKGVHSCDLGAWRIKFDLI